jgi:hypothetical protein
MILAIPSRKESGFGQQKSIHQPQTEVNRVVLFFYSVIFVLCWEQVFKVGNFTHRFGYPTRVSQSKISFPWIKLMNNQISRGWGINIVCHILHGYP